MSANAAQAIHANANAEEFSTLACQHRRIQKAWRNMRCADFLQGPGDARFPEVLKPKVNILRGHGSALKVAAENRTTMNRAFPPTGFPAPVSNPWRLAWSRGILATDTTLRAWLSPRPGAAVRCWKLRPSIVIATVFNAKSLPQLCS
jgi:hypothetical protein